MSNPTLPEPLNKVLRWLVTKWGNYEKNKENAYRDFITDTFNEWYPMYSAQNLNEELWAVNQMMNDPKIFELFLVGDLEGVNLRLGNQWSTRHHGHVIPITDKRQGLTRFITLGSVGQCAREPQFATRPRWYRPTHVVKPEKPRGFRGAELPAQALCWTFPSGQRTQQTG